MRIFLLTLAILVGTSAIAGPCTGVDRSLSPARKQALKLAIAKQLKLENPEIVKSFQAKGWFIIHVATGVSDDMFLFYNGDPINHTAVTDWGGAAAIDETDEIKAWVIENAKGIPDELATCFAWHVTKDLE